MIDLLLATCTDHPDGEPGAEHLDSALAALGVTARWAVWDDPEVDWAGAALVAVRSTWDYQDRPQDFLAWTRAPGVRWLNGPEVMAWNIDKRYLLDLGVPTVPTRLVDEVGDLEEARAAWGEVVLKPRIGASGVGLVVLGVDDPVPTLTVPSLVQPVVRSIHTAGEVSVFVLADGDGRDGWQTGSFGVRKVPAPGEVRAHEQRGALCTSIPLEAPVVSAALAAAADAARLAGGPVDYARVDLLDLGGALVVGEIELVEPGLYLDVEARTASRFAARVAQVLGGGG